MALKLQWLPFSLDVCRFPVEAELPDSIFKSPWFSICRTEVELSVVCLSQLQLQAPKVESGWVMFKIAGTLDFSLTGVLSGLTSSLAKEGISVLACSTFDTDYVLVKASEQELAHQVLASDGYEWSNAPLPSQAA